MQSGRQRIVWSANRLPLVSRRLAGGGFPVTTVVDDSDRNGADPRAVGLLAVRARTMGTPRLAMRSERYSIFRARLTTPGEGKGFGPPERLP